MIALMPLPAWFASLMQTVQTEKMEAVSLLGHPRRDIDV
jgi:hypothetical protein